MSQIISRMHTRSWNIYNGGDDENQQVVTKRKFTTKSVEPERAKPSKIPKFSTRDVYFDYNIDPNAFKDDALMEYTCQMWDYLDLYDHFSFDETITRNFLIEIRKYYNPDNMFHNFKHVWGVMHLSFQILIKGGNEHLQPLDVFAVMVAALCHDIQHPGNNNAFEQATESKLSKVRNNANIDAGILERHHALITQRLLNCDGKDHDILRGLTAEQKAHFRRQVWIIILGTDMAKHGVLLEEAQRYAAGVKGAKSAQDGSPRNGKSNKSQLNITTTGSTASSSSAASTTSISPTNLLQTVSPPARGLKRSNSSLATESCANLIAYADVAPVRSDAIDKDDPESRVAFTRLLVHTADIGAQTQSIEIALKWMERCYGEFRSQAQKEAKLGIITSPFLHDLKEDSKTFSAQIFFIEGTVEPLWTAVTTLLPELNFALTQLITNKESYRKMLAELAPSAKS